VSDLNTPEQVEERARAALAIQRPAEYSRLVRKDAAQLKAEAEAADVILHPESYRSKSRDGGVAAP
jgi:hypothetical protein